MDKKATGLALASPVILLQLLLHLRHLRLLLHLALRVSRLRNFQLRLCCRRRRRRRRRIGCLIARRWRGRVLIQPQNGGHTCVEAAAGGEARQSRLSAAHRSTCAAGRTARVVARSQRGAVDHLVAPRPVRLFAMHEPLHVRRVSRRRRGRGQAQHLARHKLGQVDLGQPAVVAAA